MENELYDIVGVTSASSGFGEWEVCGARTSDPVDLDDYKQESYANGNPLHELGVDTLPEGAEDIRGLIRNQPDHVYCFVNDDGTISYCGANLI